MSNLLPILILAIGVFAALALLMLAFSGPGGGKGMSKRLEAVRERHSNSQEVMAQVQMKRILQRRDSDMDKLVKRFVPNPALLRQRLERTGKNWTLGSYGGTCAAIAVIVTIILSIQGLPLLLAIIVGLFLGLLIPHKAVSILINRRAEKFNARFPDAIELLVRGLRSGLPVSETLTVVAKEVPDPVGSEFRSISDKIRIGRTMDQAMQDTADRLGTAEFQFFCITLAIQRETGGNLAETLSNLSDVLRKRAQMKLKIRAMSSESKASAYIVGSLPFIVFGLIWSINNAYMSKFFEDERLMIAGGGGLIWMSIGVFIMAKMVSFEI